MYVPLIIGACLCFVVLGLRFYGEANNPKTNRRPASWSRRIKIARLLVGAAIALYTISTTLNGLGDKIGP